MPFTFSHPALILPFRRLPRNWVSMTGLVVGSVAPDFEKLLKMNDGNAYSHSLTGMFFFEVPVAFGLAFLFHALVRNALIDHLPSFFRQRLNQYKTFHWPSHLDRNGAVVAGSVLVGIVSHLGWDAFTHRHGEAVMALSCLRAVVWMPLLGQTPWYYLLDMSGSLLGGIVMLWAVWRLPTEKNLPERVETIQVYWLAVSILTAGTALLRVGVGPAPKHVWDVAIILMSAGLVSLVVAGLLLRMGVLACLARKSRQEMSNIVEP